MGTIGVSFSGVFGCCGGHQVSLVELLDGPNAEWTIDELVNWNISIFNEIASNKSGLEQKTEVTNINLY
jgi:hypothetical protein